MAAGLLVSGVARAQTELFQELNTVQAVRFTGVHHISKSQIRRVLKTRGASRLPWGEKQALRLDFVRADTIAIRAVYRHQGFLEARADCRLIPAGRGRVTVVFDVHEGPRTMIRQIRLEGVRRSLERSIRAKLWAHERRYFDPGYLQLDTLVISTLYQDHGFRPQVTARAEVDTARHEASITYTVREGRIYHVGEILAYGYDPIARKLVMRELLMKPGDLDRRDKVVRSQERLYDTGLFSQVQFSPLADSTTGLVSYELRARPRPQRWVEAGISSSSSELLRLNGSWGYKNIAGQGIQGALGGVLSFERVERQNHFKRARVDVGLLEPWILGLRVRAEVDPFLEWYVDRTDPRYVLHQQFRGVDFHLRRDLNRYTTVRLTQKNVFVHQTLSFTDTLVPSVSDSTASSYRTHRVQLALERDLRDNVLLTRRGNLTLAALDIAGGALRGQSSFQKFELNQSWFTPLGQSVLASRVRAGVIAPFGPRLSLATSDDPEVARVPLEDRFRAGGVNSLRGYSENSIPAPPATGGLAILLANLEMRVPVAHLPVFGDLGFEAFVDFGNVWARPEFIRLDQFRPSVTHKEYGDHDVRYVWGIGPRLELPIGPLRVDLSWSARPSRNRATNELQRGFREPRIQFAVGPSI